MNTRLVCVDASVAAKWVFPETLSADATRLKASYDEGEAEFVAPEGFYMELASVGFHKVTREGLPLADVGEGLHRLAAVQAALVPVAPLMSRVVEISLELRLGMSWDAAYLAVAERLDCELWTADRELAGKARGSYPWVRRLGVDPLFT